MSYEAAKICGCCGACNAIACAGSDRVLVSCTGRRHARTLVTVSGSAGGSASESGQLNEGGAQYEYTVSGSWSMNFQMTALLPSNAAGLAQTLSVGGELSQHQPAVPELDGNTVEAFGSLTGSASGTWSKTATPDGGGESSSGSLAPEYTYATARGTIVIDAAGNWTITVSGSIGVGGGGMGAGGQFSLRSTSATPITLASLCAGTPIASTGTGEGSGSSGVSIDNNSVAGEIYTSSIDYDGGGSLTATRVAAVAEAEDPVLAFGCARYLDVSAHLRRGHVSEGFGDITGRIVLDPGLGDSYGVCGDFPARWQGAGIYSFFVDDPGSLDHGAHEVAVVINVTGEPGGTAETRSRFGAFARPMSVDVSDGAVGPFILYVDGGNATAPIEAGATPAQVRAALEAIPYLADEFVRVRGPGTSDFSTYRITIARRYGGAAHQLLATESFENPLHTVTIGYTEAVTPYASTAFKTSDRCVENGSATTVAGFAPGHGPGATLSFSPSARRAGDRTFYCDCPPECAASAVVLILGGQLSLDLFSTSPPLSADPCTYLFEEDANYTGTYAFNSSRGRYDLMLYDVATGELAMYAFRYCTPGGSLGPLTVAFRGGTLANDPTITAEVA